MLKEAVYSDYSSLNDYNNECDYNERIILDYDDCSGWTREDLGDHTFHIYMRNKRNYCFDRNAECPLQEDGEYKKGYVVFPLSLHDHSLVRVGLFASAFFDEWDSTLNAGYIYTNKEQYEKLHGKDTWCKVPNLMKKTYEKVSLEEFKKYLQEIAESEIKELNLLLEGSVWRMIHEIKEELRVTYKNGETKSCYNWVEVDTCGGFVTDSVNDIDFVRDENIPVFICNGVFNNHTYNIP